MAAAAQLNKAGHTVTVYERNDRVGGLLQYGIPSMKLSKEVVKRRIDLLAAEGITFKTNCFIGKDVLAEELVKNNDAVLLTTGATWPRDLPLPKRDLNGIYFAMEFLESGQKKQLGGTKENISATGKDVLVIGGGDTGCDCIATSLRQGVCICCVKYIELFHTFNCSLRNLYFLNFRPSQLHHLKFFRLRHQAVPVIIHGLNGQKFSVLIMDTKKLKVGVD